jgi:hypothetical protein
MKASSESGEWAMLISWMAALVAFMARMFLGRKWFSEWGEGGMTLFWNLKRPAVARATKAEET